MPKMVQLREFQKNALFALEDPKATSHHLLCISPTGSGKSLIFERASRVVGRKTLLITPLVALARQQYKKFQSLQIPVSLGSGGAKQPPPSSQSGVWIVSPETLNFPNKMDLLKKWKPNFMVVDECHCLWEWGDRFRPSFRNLPRLLTELSISRSLWLTATLPFTAKQELRKQIPVPMIELGEFNLPQQIHLSVLRIPIQDRIEALVH